MLWGVLVQRFLCKHFTLDCEPRNTIAQDAGPIPVVSTSLFGGDSQPDQESTKPGAESWRALLWLFE